MMYLVHLFKPFWLKKNFKAILFPKIGKFAVFNVLKFARFPILSSKIIFFYNKMF